MAGAPSTPIALAVPCYTSWFKLNNGSYLAHEYCLHYLLECHIFGIILTAMNSGRGRHGQFFCSGPRTGARVENMSRPTTGLQKGQ